MLRKQTNALFALIALNLTVGNALGGTVFLEGSQRSYSQQAVNDLDYRSAKVGAQVPGNGWGVWGEYEHFNTQNYGEARNVEVAGIKSLGPINVTGAFATCNDFRFKASRLYLAEIQMPFNDVGFTPYIGASQEEYNALIKNVFNYYKLGAVKNLGEGFSLLMQYQYIDNENEDKTIDKVGSQVAATMSYNEAGFMAQLGGQFSCTGSKASCDRSATRDEYFESNFLVRWMTNNSWGLRGQLSYVYQKSFFIRETSSEIGRSSWIIRVGPQIEF